MTIATGKQPLFKMYMVLSAFVIVNCTMSGVQLKTSKTRCPMAILGWKLPVILL